MRNTERWHPSAVSNLYYRRTAVFMGAYILLNVLAILGVVEGLASPARYVFALAVGALVGGQIWAMVAWMRDSDEFVRAVAVKRFVVGAGVAFAFVTTWGFLTTYAAAPAFPAMMIFPVFCAAFGLASPFVQTSH